MGKSLSSRLKENKLSLCLGVISILLAVAVIVLAVELSKSLDDNADDGSSSNSTDSTPTTPAPTEPWEVELRIPKEVVPVHYHVTLHPDLSAGLFSGSVVVDFQITGSRDWIPIHVKQLNVTSILLKDSKSNDVVIARQLTYEPNEFLVLFPKATLAIGSYSLQINFTGSLTGKIVGFYESVYADINGNGRSIATSKFEPVDARAAFPCFDEPALKATFTISLVRPALEYSALSNMNILREDDGPGSNEKTVHFSTSVAMSTYLVCFIVSDFKSLGPVNVNNNGVDLPVEVFTTPQQTQHSQLARDVAQQVTQYYLEYFGVPYPLPKLDLIAIPDFVSGAMEHWGLITFRETALLFDEKTNSATAQKRVASVVAHEIAHQWFGNLVTMAWWDDLWLNEGFASFMESKALHEGVPACADWSILEQVVLDDLQPVMITDSAVNSHPIVQTVSNPDQINQLFDSVSYDKGQAVLRMLEDFLDPAVFQKGLQSYLSTHKFGNAKTDDLWEHLNAAANSAPGSVKSVMDTWTRQMGYPVVQVQRKADQISITQQRYLADKDATYDDNQSPYKYKWDIPIRYTTSADPLTPSAVVWLHRDQQQLNLDINNTVTFVKVNTRQVGFYRVNYDDQTWKVLTRNTQKLSPLDRAHLLNDVFSLASTGYTNYTNALDMVVTLGSEVDYLPWAAALEALYNLDLLLTETTAYPAFRIFVAGLLSPRYGDKVGQFNWKVPDNDSHLSRLLRSKILAASCYFGLPECKKDVGALFELWLSRPTTTVIAPDLRSLVYSQGMAAAGNEANWDKTWAVYKKESNAQERVNLLQALAYVQEPWLLQRYLNLAWEEENVRSQDYFSLLGFMAGTRVGAPIVWDYFRSNWPQLVERFGLQHRYLGSTILAVTKSFTSQTRLDELEGFYKKYPEAGAGAASRDNAQERIATRVLWTSRNTSPILAWLAGH